MPPTIRSVRLWAHATVFGFLLGPAALLTAPSAGAQSAPARPPNIFQRIGGAVDKVAGAANRQHAADSTGQRAGPTGSGIEVVRAGFVAGDSLRAPAAPDSGVTRTPASAACGTARLCVPGWDLRVVSVGVPDTLLAADTRTAVSAVIENRGRTASPASELQLCFAQGDRCGQRVAVLDIPSLASGERVRFEQPVAVANLPQTFDKHWAFVAVVDPDNATHEVNRTNNVGRSRPFGIDRPALEVLTYQVPTAIPWGARALPVSLRLRNKSFAAASPATEVEFTAGLQGIACNGGNWGSGTTRLAVPALAPRQEWAAEVVVHDEHVGMPYQGAKSCHETVSRLLLDPDRRVQWASTQEPSVVRTYGLTGAPIR